MGIQMSYLPFLFTHVSIMTLLFFPGTEGDVSVSSFRLLRYLSARGRRKEQIPCFSSLQGLPAPRQQKKEVGS